MIFVQNSSPKRPWSKQSGRPRPSTTATPRKSALRSHSAFIPFARYSDRLLVAGWPWDKRAEFSSGVILGLIVSLLAAPPPSLALLRRDIVLQVLDCLLARSNQPVP